MMKTAIRFTALAAALACGLVATRAGGAQPQAQAQPGGAVVTEQRPAGAFSAIELAGPWHVVIEAQGQPALSLTGTRQALDEIDTAVRGDTLVVRPRGREGVHFHFGIGRRHEDPVIHITAAALTSLRMSGSGDVELNHLQGNAFAIANGGSGDLRAGGTVRRLSVANAGSGDLDLRGLETADLNLDMNGSGDVQLAGLTNTLSVQVNGSGDLNADGLRAARVEARMHGSGDVHLAGSSRELRLDSAGSGDFDGCGLAVETASSVQHGPGNACIAGKLRSFEGELAGSGDLSVRGLQAQSARLRMHGSGDADLAGTVGQLTAELGGSGELHANGLSAGHADIQVHGSGSAAVRVLDQGAAGAQGRLLLVDRSGTRTRQ